MSLFRKMIMVAGILAVFGISALSCDRVDKALETRDKAKKLQSEVEQKADELRKKVDQAAEAGRIRKGTDDRDPSSSEDKKSEDEGRSGDERSKHAKDRD